MKRISFFAILFLAISFFACEKDKDDNPSNAEVIVPEKFSIDLPSSISSSNTKKSTEDGILRGDEIYEHMRFFVFLGELSAQMVEEIMASISTYNLSQELEVTYTSDDDGRQKKMVVIENATYNGATWNFGLTITDANNKAMEIFWNTNPVKGISILKPSEIDHNYVENPDMLIMLEYSEAEPNYDAQMIVSVETFKMNEAEQFAMNKVKMFAGKKGDIIEVFGNSNHPNLTFDTPENSAFEKGRNWAFRARSHEILNVAVAEVALPPSSLENTTNMMTEYSLLNVFRQVIRINFNLDSNIPDAAIDAYLTNAQPPAYFSNTGFMASGANIPSNEVFSSTFIDLSALTPYNPKDIKELGLSFSN